MKITAFFISLAMSFLSIFGISFKHNEQTKIDLYYSDVEQRQATDKTDEIKELLSSVMQRTPNITECTEKKPFADDNRIKAIFFDGEEYMGKAAKVFAYIGFPENATESSPVPAMVLVHGGAGHAYAEWVKYWVDNGYAAISIDGFGQIPADGEYTSETVWSVNPDSHMTIDELSTCDKPIKDQWFYYYITDVILANNILRADSRIKTDNIGITGISWGGIATSVVIGYDSRFKFAIPVYGCGYLDECSSMLNSLMKNENAKNTWEPSLLLGNVKMPVLWIDGDNDPFFSVDSATKTASVTPNATLTILHKFAHGQNEGAYAPEILRFANEQNGLGNGNIKINGLSFDNGRAVISFDTPDDARNIKVKVYYRTSPLEYDGIHLKEEWKSSNGIVLGNMASVKLPSEYEMIYFSVEGTTGSVFNCESIHASTGIYTFSQKAEFYCNM